MKCKELARQIMKYSSEEVVLPGLRTLSGESRLLHSNWSAQSFYIRQCFSNFVQKCNLFFFLRSRWACAGFSPSSTAQVRPPDLKAGSFIRLLLWSRSFETHSLDSASTVSSSRTSPLCRVSPTPHGGGAGGCPSSRVPAESSL